MLTPEETQAFFNFPEHIKFTFDWPSISTGEKIQLEENLFVKYYAKDRVPGLRAYRFTNIIGQRHNPYGPASVYKDGSHFYFIKDKAHRIGGPAWLNVDNHGEHPRFYIQGQNYNTEIEYWIAVEKYLKDHPEEVYENSSQD